MTFVLFAKKKIGWLSCDQTHKQRVKAAWATKTAAPSSQAGVHLLPLSCAAPFLNPNVLAVSALQVLLPVSSVPLSPLHPVHGALALLVVLEYPSHTKKSREVPRLRELLLLYY